jgi:hypothetical protein
MSAALGFLAWWQDFWFRERPLVDLAISRIVLVAIVLYLDAGGRFLRVAMVASEHWSSIPLLRVFGIGQPGLDQLFWLERATQVALVAAGLGLLTNVSLVVALALQFLQECYLNCLGKVTHATLPMLYALLFFALSPCGRRLSIDAVIRRARQGGESADANPIISRYAGWPLDLLFVELAAFYFQAGSSKLQDAGLAWADGYSLQFYLLDLHQPAGMWLAGHLALCSALSAAVLVFELGFPLAIFVRRLRPFFLLGGFAFHLSTSVFMGIAFWPVWALYGLFVPWSRIVYRGASRLAPNGAGT